MSFQYRIILGAFLISVGSVIGFQAKKKVKEDYNILPPEVAFMNKCTSAMRTHNVEFKQGANQNKGCACITKTLMSKTEQAEIPAVKDYMYLLMELGGDNARETIDMEYFEQSFEEINTRHSLSELKSLTYFGTIGEAVTTCGNKDYHTKENVGVLASLYPKSSQIAVAQSEVESKPKPSKPAPLKLRGPSKG